MRSWAVRVGSVEMSLRARRLPPRATGRFVEGPRPEPTYVRRSAEAAITAIARVAELGMPENPQSVDDITWYHTIDLPDGTATPGAFDHREIVAGYGFPADMSGLRALDVAAFDGFWAFTMEDRGADVTAVDLARHNDSDLPPPARALLDATYGDVPTAPGFDFARRARGSAVKKVRCSVYDLAAEGLGSFDFVHCADVLLHLERPWQALRAIRSVTSGTALIVDAFEPTLERGPVGPTMEYRGGWFDVIWWIPSLDALAQMVIDAGFSNVRLHRTYNIGQVGNRYGGVWRAALLADA